MKQLILFHKNLKIGHKIGFWGVVIGCLTLITALLAWQFPVSSVNAKHTSVTQYQALNHYPDGHLKITGSGVKIIIKKNRKNIPFGNITVSGSGKQSMFYVPDGQKILLSLMGSGIKVIVDRSISDQIQVTDSGSGNMVSEN